MSSFTKAVVSTPLAPAAIGPYSQVYIHPDDEMTICHWNKAISAGGFVFVSGCIGLTPEKVLLEGVEAQAHQVLTNLKNILEAAGSDLSKVVKSTILLADMKYFGEINTIYAQYFPVDPPARATYAVAGLPLGALVEIECVAIE